MKQLEIFVDSNVIQLKQWLKCMQHNLIQIFINSRMLLMIPVIDGLSHYVLDSSEFADLKKTNIGSTNTENSKYY